MDMEKDKPKQKKLISLKPNPSGPDGLSRLAPRCAVPAAPLSQPRMTQAGPVINCEGRIQRLIRLGAPAAKPRLLSRALSAPCFPRKPACIQPSRTHKLVRLHSARLLSMGKLIFNTFPAIYRDRPKVALRTGQIYPRGNR